MQGPERVDVLQLGLDAKLIGSGAADRDVRLCAQLAFLHIGLRRADRAQQRTKLHGVVARLVGGAEVWFAHDLHQGHASAIEVDERLPRPVQLVASMDELARVLFQVHAANAHLARPDLQEAIDAHGQVVLADLVALGQVRIHVVLAVELGVPRDLAVESQGGLEACLDGGAVRHRQNTGQAQAHLAHVCVRRCVQRSHPAAAKHLGQRLRLDVHLHADHDFPFTSPLAGGRAPAGHGGGGGVVLPTRQPLPPQLSSRLPLRMREPRAARRSRPTAARAPGDQPAAPPTCRTEH